MPVLKTGAMADPILEVQRLTKHFGGLRAVHLDLTIEPGELRCLIGPNGAGKSTFFRIVTGGMRPSSGTVRFRGHVITCWDAFRVARLGMSIKFQVASVLEELTVLENLHIAAVFRFGNREGRRRAREMDAHLDHGRHAFWRDLHVARLAVQAHVEPLADLLTFAFRHAEHARDHFDGERCRGVGHDVELVGPFEEMMGHAGALVLHRTGDKAGVIEGAADPRSDGRAAGF